MEIPAQSLSFNKPVKASANPHPQWRDAGLVNNGNWVGHYRKPANVDQTPWIEIALEKPEKISKVIIFVSNKAINAFEIQYLKNGNWETAYGGGSVENGKSILWPDITTRNLRYILNKFSTMPGIYEFIML